MRLLRCIAAAVVGASSLYRYGVQAHSVQRNPLNYLSIVDDPVIHTPSHRAHSNSHFDLTFQLHNKRQFVKLKLEPNHDILADGATVSYLGADGKIRSTEPIDRTAHKVFKGHTFIQHKAGAEWTNVGWARIMLLQDGVRPVFEGAFRMEGNHHHVQTRHNFLATKHLQDPGIEDESEDLMVVWRDSDISADDPRQELKRSLEGGASCTSDELSFNVQPEHPVYRAMLKRDTGFWGSIYTKSMFARDNIDGSQTSGNGAGVNLVSSIGNTAGCFSTRRVALVGIVTDCTYTASFNSSESVHKNVITQMNSASVLYEDSFNISLGIRNLTVTDPGCPGTAPSTALWNVPCSNSAQIQDRLNLFSAWRGQFQDDNAYWTLLSTCGTGSAVGLAWLGQACITTSQSSSSNGVNETVSGANVIVKTSTEWQVIAHEVGHTFGAVHDCVASTCNDGTTVNAQQCCPLSTSTCDAGGQFIMNPATSPAIQKFSPCSIGNICSAIGRNSVKTSCLISNKNVPTISDSQCGNGIVETGEDCDCGGEQGCGNNPCCDAKTCKFKTSAVCDPSNEDCCSSQCQFSSSGTVCRASTGQCDPQETCSGTSALCPADTTTSDGTSCGDSGASLSCSSGQCTSRDLQCKTLMGVYTTNNSTYACSSSGCQISCASPEFGVGKCYLMQQNFLDGTACGGGGECSNGVCNGSSVGGEISSWINSNKPLVIGLSVGIGGLLVLAILSCCISSWRRRRRMARKPPVVQPIYPNPVSQMAQGGWGRGGRSRGYVQPQWVEPIPEPNVPGYGARWQQPPPTYSEGGYGAEHGGAAVRYA